MLLRKDGSITGWGFGSPSYISQTFQNIQGNIAKVSTSTSNMIMTLKDGRVTGFGPWNFYQPSGLFPSNVRQGHVLNAVTSDRGTAYCLYYDDKMLTGVGEGTWGIGTFDPVARPNSDYRNNDYYKDMACSYYFGIVLSEKGQTSNWGNDFWQSIGGVELSPSSSFWGALGGSGSVTGISARYYNAWAVSKDGLVTGWSMFSPNELITGAGGIPNSIQGNTVQVVNGRSHALALLKNKTVVGWGLNTDGQINIPNSIQGFVTGISAGQYHSLALLDDGSVTGWGKNNNGQITFPISI